MKKRITLRKNEDHRLRAGHLWAFSNEIESAEGEPAAGEIVDILSHSGKFIGRGFYNPHSLIAARILTRRDEEIDFQFFKRRIENAVALRAKIYPSEQAVRLVHGESDFLPGLVIDRYGSVCVLQSFSFGMDSRQTLICDVLDSLISPAGIIERNEAQMRTLETLPLRSGLLRGTSPQVTVTEHGITYNVNLLEGQKTGLFLDQRENRRAFRRYAGAGRVLDVCSNDGGFALNAAAAGAAECMGVDSSAEAVKRAQANAAANHADQRVRFQAGDMFGYLEECAKRGDRFDAINLDPPSFAKNRKSIATARRGYRQLHDLAFSLLKPGGILATACCSHHIDDSTFLSIVEGSAHHAERFLQLLEWHGAAPDHPVLPAMPETQYLKFGIFRAG